MLTTFLKEHCGHAQIHQALLAIAGPVADDRVHLTNSSWVIDAGELQRSFGLQVRIVNDFEAVALSLPSLTPSAGLGVACLIDRSERPMVIASESLVEATAAQEKLGRAKRRGRLLTAVAVGSK